MTEPTIDDQVAEFRKELATALTIDTAQFSRDVQQLTESLINAETHELAASAIHDIDETHPRPYANAVIVGGVSAFATSALIRATFDELSGPNGYIARMLEVSWTVRNLGITADSLTYVTSGEVL